MLLRAAARQRASAAAHREAFKQPSKRHICDILHAIHVICHTCDTLYTASQSKGVGHPEGLRSLSFPPSLSPHLARAHNVPEIEGDAAVAHERVARQVVPLVDVDRVLAVGHDVEQKAATPNKQRGGQGSAGAQKGRGNERRLAWCCWRGSRHPQTSVHPPRCAHPSCVHPPTPSSLHPPSPACPCNPSPCRLFQTSSFKPTHYLPTHSTPPSPPGHRTLSGHPTPDPPLRSSRSTTSLAMPPTHLFGHPVHPPF